MAMTFTVEKITNGAITSKTLSSLKMANAVARQIGGRVLPPAGIEPHVWAMIDPGARENYLNKLGVMQS
jgi:hypothetical protein